MRALDERRRGGPAVGARQRCATLLLERTYSRSTCSATVRRESRRSRGGRIMSKVVGIDLGTTNSLVAFVEDGVPASSRDESGDRLLPSIVSVDAHGTVYVGREAQRRLLTDSARTVYSVKRFMGTRHRRRERRGALVPVRGQRRGRRRRPHPPRRARVDAAGDLGVHPPRAEAPRGGVLRAGGRHRPRGRPRRSSPCRRTSTTRSARRRATPAAWPASRCCASSTSRPRRRWPTASTSAARASSRSTTSAAARSTSRS